MERRWKMILRGQKGGSFDEPCALVLHMYFTGAGVIDI